MVAKLHSRYVSAMDGFTVVGVAHNGADALRAAEQLCPDLVLLDIYLPDMDGIDVLRALRTAEERDASRPSTDALFITAAKDAGVIRAALRAGALPLALHPAMTFTGTSVDVQRLAGCSFGVTAPEELRLAAEALVIEMGGEPEWIAEESRPLYHAALALGANHLVTLVAESMELLAK
ncbi:oxidoreductase, partial [Streptomyces cavourensis]